MLRDLVRISEVVSGEATLLFSLPEGALPLPGFVLVGIELFGIVFVPEGGRGGEQGEPAISSLITFPSMDPCCKIKRDFMTLSTSASPKFPKVVSFTKHLKPLGYY